jgi:hypothetical protein
MNILKTPREKLLEEAGATPKSVGMVRTPQQMLLQESGIMPRFSNGGNINPADMRAEIAVGQPNVAKPILKLNNQSLFDSLKQVINNPGQINKNEIDPKAMALLNTLFGPNIFAANENQT